MAFKIALLACIASVAVASPQLVRIDNGNTFNFDLLNNELNRQEEQETTTFVPILRYIDTQNPDGSYTYGYESGDGTYKIETRYATGEVKGKYGYYDDTGYLREVEYGAAPELGFMPQGDGLEFIEPQFAVTPRPTVAKAAPRPVTSAPTFKSFAPTPRPQQVIAPTPRAVAPTPRPVETVRSGRRDPAKDFITNRGRRVTVVKRKRPQVARPKPAPLVRRKSQPIPTRAPAPAPAPVQQVFQPQQPAFQPQQPVIQPQQRFLPVPPVQQVFTTDFKCAHCGHFNGHPFISQFSPANGVFSYSY